MTLAPLLPLPFAGAAMLAAAAAICQEDTTAEVDEAYLRGRTRKVTLRAAAEAATQACPVYIPTVLTGEDEEEEDESITSYSRSYRDTFDGDDSTVDDHSTVNPFEFSFRSKRQNKVFVEKVRRNFGPAMTRWMRKGGGSHQSSSRRTFSTASWKERKPSTQKQKIETVVEGAKEDDFTTLEDEEVMRLGTPQPDNTTPVLRILPIHPSGRRPPRYPQHSSPYLAATGTGAEARYNVTPQRKFKGLSSTSRPQQQQPLNRYFSDDETSFEEGQVILQTASGAQGRPPPEFTFKPGSPFPTRPGGLRRGGSRITRPQVTIPNTQNMGVDLESLGYTASFQDDNDSVIEGPFDFLNPFRVPTLSRKRRKGPQDIPPTRDSNNQKHGPSLNKFVSFNTGGEPPGVAQIKKVSKKNVSDKNVSEKNSSLHLLRPIEPTKPSANEKTNPAPDKSLRPIEPKKPSAIKKTKPEPDKSPLQTLKSDTRPSGYVGGDFLAGTVCEIPANLCNVIAYEPVNKRLLAVGQKDCVVLLETNTYTLVHSFPRPEAVSCLKWISIEDSPPLLAVASVDGTVVVVRVEEAFMESQGPVVVHEFKAEGQVKALDAGVIGHAAASSTLLLAVGDKTGGLTLVSLSVRDSFRKLARKTVRRFSAGVSGVAVCEEYDWLAVSTYAGEVVVYQLKRDGATEAVHLEPSTLWKTLQNGPVLTVVFGRDSTSTSVSPLLAFGGFDKMVHFVDTEIWRNARSLMMGGTVNTISFDPFARYVGVGCRDRTFSLFDTSTYVAIKIFRSTGWVTSISWGPFQLGLRDIIAVRSDKGCITIVDLTPMDISHVRLVSSEGPHSSATWSRDGRYIARSIGSRLVVSDSCDDFRDVISSELEGGILKVVFCKAEGMDDMIAVLHNDGRFTVLRLCVGGQGEFAAMNGTVLMTLRTCFVSNELKALAWSPDGSVVAVGGKDKLLYMFSVGSGSPHIEPIEFNGRIWDIAFAPEPAFKGDTLGAFVAVALGDNSALVLNRSMKPLVQIVRSGTVRCLHFHPKLPLLALGDATGTVVVVNHETENVVCEIATDGRPYASAFSPVGDILAIGTDNCRCSLYETIGYKIIQEVSLTGPCQCVAFSPDGSFLVLGSPSDDYRMIRLGTLLGINLVPLEIEELPDWARSEALSRSPLGPPYIERLITDGGHGSPRAAKIVKENPGAINTINRSNGEGPFETALSHGNTELIRELLASLVSHPSSPNGADASLALSTTIPLRARDLLEEMAHSYHPDVLVDILRDLDFVAVPYARPILGSKGDRLICGSSNYSDPWRNVRRVDAAAKGFRHGTTQVPAVLPLPGLGELDFLSALLNRSAPGTFDNNAIAVVLKVMWEQYVGVYFYLDFAVSTALVLCWVALVERTASPDTDILDFSGTTDNWLVWATLLLNMLVQTKETVLLILGKRKLGGVTLWSVAGWLAILTVYTYCATLYFDGIGSDALVPIASLGMVPMTIKFISFFRGFKLTGCILSVLVSSGRDVCAFLVVLATLVVGFTVSFRLLFRDTGDVSYGSLRRALFSTFETSVTGWFDSTLVFENDNPQISALMMVLAITCTFVVALNGLVAILVDSYTRAKEHAVVHRRREMAEMIVDYMSLLPKWKRNRIETQTQWFHARMEVGADGSLRPPRNVGEDVSAQSTGFNALRRDITKLSESSQDAHQKDLHKLKKELDLELSSIRDSVTDELALIADDLRELRNLRTTQATQC